MQLGPRIVVITSIFFDFYLQYWLLLPLGFVYQRAGRTWNVVKYFPLLNPLVLPKSQNITHAWLDSIS